MPPAPLDRGGSPRSRALMLAAVLGILPACAREPEVRPIPPTSAVVDVPTEFTLRKIGQAGRSTRRSPAEVARSPGGLYVVEHEAAKRLVSIALHPMHTRAVRLALQQRTSTEGVEAWIREFDEIVRSNASASPHDLDGYGSSLLTGLPEHPYALFGLTTGTATRGVTDALGRLSIGAGLERMLIAIPHHGRIRFAILTPDMFKQGVARHSRDLWSTSDSSDALSIDVADAGLQNDSVTVVRVVYEGRCDGYERFDCRVEVVCRDDSKVVFEGKVSREAYVMARGAPRRVAITFRPVARRKVVVPLVVELSEAQVADGLRLLGHFGGVVVRVREVRLREEMEQGVLACDWTNRPAFPERLYYRVGVAGPRGDFADLGQGHDVEGIVPRGWRGRVTFFENRAFDSSGSVLGTAEWSTKTPKAKDE